MRSNGCRVPQRSRPRSVQHGVRRNSVASVLKAFGQPQTQLRARNCQRGDAVEVQRKVGWLGGSLILEADRLLAALRRHLPFVVGSRVVWPQPLTEI